MPSPTVKHEAKICYLVEKILTLKTDIYQDSKGDISNTCFYNFLWIV